MVHLFARVTRNTITDEFQRDVAEQLWLWPFDRHDFPLQERSSVGHRQVFKARRRRNRLLKHAKGYYGARRKAFHVAIEQVHNAWEDAYRHRRTKKRDFRRLWITRINAASRMNGVNYSQFIAGLKRSNIELDRKVLAEIAIADPGGFKAVVDAID